jgi:PAS domain S-box-containing protein
MQLQNDQYLYQTVMAAPIGICILDAASLTCEIVNDKFLEIAGTPYDTVFGQFYWDSFAEARPYYEDALTGVLRTGETFYADDVELMLIRYGREEMVFVTFVYSPIKTSEGNVTKIAVWVLENTSQATARRKLEQVNDQLRASQEEILGLNEELAAINEELVSSNEEATAVNEELTNANIELKKTYRELEGSRNDLLFTIHAAGLGTFDLNPITNLFSGNAVLKSWFGLRADEEIDPELATNVIAAFDRERVIAAILEALDYRSEGKYDIEYAITNSKEPEFRIVHAKGKTLFNEAKQPVRLSGTLQDITQERKASLAVEEAREQFNLIADNISQLAWMTDETGYIFWYNQRWYDYTGTTLEEMLGWGWDKVNHPDHLDIVLEKWIANIKSGEVFELTFPLRGKDGVFRWFLTRAVPLKDDNGKVIRWFGTNTDINEQKADEQRKNDFIGMVSHELKTPLTSLTALIQMTNVKLKNCQDTFLAGAMEKANNQVKKMITMINGFLNISRLESSNILIDKRDFNLDELIEEVIHETELTVSTHRLTFDRRRSIKIHADQDKIGSVISNMISNAVKYSPKGKEIAIKCEVVDHTAQVCIKDEGMGINPRDQEKLFDRYYRVENDNTRHISGFGIGLYLSAEIIKHHNGKIWVESEPGNGSKFCFSLPIEAS